MDTILSYLEGNAPTLFKSVFIGETALFILYFLPLYVLSVYLAFYIVKKIAAFLSRIGCIGILLLIFLVIPFILGNLFMFLYFPLVYIASKSSIITESYTEQNIYFHLIGIAVLALLGFFIIPRYYKFTLKTLFSRYYRKRASAKFIKQWKQHPEIIAISDVLLPNIYRGVLVHGGAGSGKSKSVIYPIIYQMLLKQFTGIVYDFKSPQFLTYIKRIEKLARQNEVKTHRVVVIDFKDVLHSERVNLLSGIGNIAQLKELSHTLWANLNTNAIKNRDFWNTSAENVLTATFWTLIKAFPKYATVPHAIALINTFSVKELISFLHVDVQAKMLVSAIISASDLRAEKQLSGTLGTLQNFVSGIITPEIFWLLSGSRMYVPNDPGDPSIVILGNDSTLYQTYSPIIALISSAMLSKMNMPGRLKSFVVFDELPTIFIPNLETLPATARENRIATVAGIQDMSQLIDKYGKDKTDIILSNLGNQFFGRSTLEKTADYISKLFGKQDKLFTSQTEGTATSIRSSSDSFSTTQSYQERSRIKPQDILNYAPGVFSGITAQGNYPEFIGKKLNEFDIMQAAKESNLSWSSLDIEKTIRHSHEEIARNFDTIISDIENIRK